MKISGTTALYGIIGDPIEHTLSPLMHNSTIAEMGIDAVYVPFHVKPHDLEQAVRGMKVFDIKGLNVTAPHKTRVIEFLDRITDDAEAIGAVNTIINDNDILTGDNTDVYGFLKCLEKGGIENLPERVCVIGAGGAARGVVYACAKKDEVTEIVIINRTLARAEKLAADLSQVSGTSITTMPAEKKVFESMLPSAGLIINTTSVGMYPQVDVSPVPDPAVFHDKQVVCDIIYNPLETSFLKDAALKGAHTVGGLGMLVYQGARSLSLWSGMDAPVEAMLSVLRENLLRVS
ncbi:shikimate dehydrogenase [Candidatus Latescibacterota bacterium]